MALPATEELLEGIRGVLHRGEAPAGRGIPEGTLLAGLHEDLDVDQTARLALTGVLAEPVIVSMQASEARPAQPASHTIYDIVVRIVLVIGMSSEERVDAPARDRRKGELFALIGQVVQALELPGNLATTGLLSQVLRQATPGVVAEFQLADDDESAFLQGEVDLSGFLRVETGS